MENVRTVYADMPSNIKAYTIFDGIDYYTIVLNENLSHDQNMKSYMHELFHIMNGDFEKNTKSGLIELHAHHNI